MNREDWKLARRLIDQSKIKRAINNCIPFKSAGAGAIVPVLLQNGVEYFASYLCSILSACLAYGYIPRSWGEVGVTSIPKPRKPDYIEVRSYQPISLSSFLLKTNGRIR
jgi:hypothetical protein